MGTPRGVDMDLAIDAAWMTLDSDESRVGWDFTDVGFGSLAGFVVN